jgi:hypothetical protein
MLVKLMVDNGNDAVHIAGSFVPPEAEAITGTKQSFAPAPASNARQHTITRQPVIIT